MAEPPYTHLEEYPPKPVYPTQEGIPKQHVYLPEQGNPPAYAPNQQACVVPTTAVIAREVQVQPKDYLALSIIVMICCCLPLGIVALIKSQEVGTRFRAGDFDGAQESSKAAKTYGSIGLGIGIALHSIWIVYLIVNVVIAVVLIATVDVDYNYNGY